MHLLNLHELLKLFTLQYNLLIVKLNIQSTKIKELNIIYLLSSKQDFQLKTSSNVDFVYRTNGVV